MSMRAQNLELDDRREIWKALEWLNPLERIAFVQWCCGQASGPNKSAVFVDKHSGCVEEAYRDIMALELQFGLDLSVAAKELIRRARRT